MSKQTKKVDLNQLAKSIVEKATDHTKDRPKDTTKIKQTVKEKGNK